MFDLCSAIDLYVNVENGRLRFRDFGCKIPCGILWVQRGWMVEWTSVGYNGFVVGGMWYPTGLVMGLPL